MEIDDLIKENPTLKNRKETLSQQLPKAYTCALCKKTFDKPKTYFMGSFLLELGIYIVAIFAALFFGFWILILPVIFSFVRMCSRRKGCPYCKSINFYKNH